MSYTLKELRAIPTERLIVEHDHHAQHTVVGVQYYLDELARRDGAAANERALELSRAAVKLTEAAAADGRAVARLTQVITVLTTVNVVATLALLVDAM